MTEEWRVVAVNPHYEVSNDGRVRRCTGRTAGRAVKPFMLFGYLKVSLNDRGRSRKHFVHRLVIEAFVGPAPSARHRTAHCDGNPLNNVPSNLRWATQRENIHDKWKHGTMVCGERVRTAKLEPAEVQEMRRRRASGETMSSLASAFGVSLPQVKNVCYFKHWRHLPVDGAAHV